jgi:hypothetical protein
VLVGGLDEGVVLGLGYDEIGVGHGKWSIMGPIGRICPIGPIDFEFRRPS